MADCRYLRCRTNKSSWYYEILFIRKREANLFIIIIIIIISFSFFFFLFLSIRHRVFTQDLGWGREGILCILYIYVFCSFFGMIFFNYIDSTLLIRWTFPQRSLFFLYSTSAGTTRYFANVFIWLLYPRLLLLLLLLLFVCLLCHLGHIRSLLSSRINL